MPASASQSPPPASPLEMEHQAEATDFSPLQCLFCTCQSPELELNVSHMQKAHGLFIPDRDRLLVDVDTLLGYLHLVVSGYCECLFCGTQRATAEAARQHMVGKGHCKIDIESEDSEYRDFYGEDQDGDSESEDPDAPPPPGLSVPALAIPTDGSSLRLPSGKTLSHRTSRRPRPTRPRADSPEPADTRPGLTPNVPAASSRLAADPNRSTALTTRAEQRHADFTGRQLAQLRAEDRRSLMHLPVSEQRALLAVQKKQIDKAKRAERAMRGRVEGMGNKTLMKHFVIDVPGRLNG